MLERTANKLDHALTKKSPLNEWQIEQNFLRPFEPIADTGPPPLLYSVRKDNMISWKSNRYSLPFGTYTGRGSQVSLKSRPVLLYQSVQSDPPLVAQLENLK